MNRIDLEATDSSSSDEIEAVPSKVWDEETVKSGRPGRQSNSSRSHPKPKSSSMRRFKSSRYKGLKLSQLLCAVYIVAMTILYYPNGYFDPSAFVNLWSETTNVTDKMALICLFGARVSAFIMYHPTAAAHTRSLSRRRCDASNHHATRASNYRNCYVQFISLQ